MSGDDTGSGAANDPGRPGPPATPPAQVPAAPPGPPPITPPADIPPAPYPTPAAAATPPPPTLPAPAPGPLRAVDRRTLILGAAAALFFVLFLLSGPLGLWPSSAQLGGASPAKARSEIETVAARFGRNLVNFSYKTLDTDLSRVRRDATGNFENEFRQAMGINFASALRKAKATSRGTVKGTIVSTQRKDDAVVIVYLTQSVSNAKSPKPRALPRFLQLTLVRSGGTWKVDDVKQLEIRAA
jgi:Mce-associated membrane protein